jgi:eukaryotic-like serine/threonine-protein kinase
MAPDSGAARLTAERWQRIESIFNGAIETSSGDRSQYLRKQCNGDEFLLAELEGMLRAFDGEQKAPAAKDAVPEVSHAGTVVGEYRIDRELGHGGMGTVYLAHRADGQFEQQVALKVVSAHLRTEFFTERFRTERQILAQLNHPNITRLLDGGVTKDGDPYLVMEYVDGMPIHRYCDSHLLAIPDRIRLFLQVCSAVEYAHRNLIVHRDLKPGNIFVTGDGVPKLLDFGTAKLLMLTAEDSTTTRFGMMTPRYASPEQLRGELVNTGTDVYSLGVMLYELLTGRWPFGDPDSPIAGLERAVRDVEPASPASVITDESARLRSESKPKLARLLDGDLRSVINKAIEADPRRRYPSVEQLSEDLRRCLDGQPVLARPQTLLYRVNKFVRRNWLPVTGAAIFILGLSAATGLAIREAQVARAQATKAEAVTRFLQDVIYAGEPEDVKDRSVLQAMEIARGRLDEVKDQPEVELSIRVALGYVYMANSLLPQAEKELKRAETLARQTNNKEMLASTLLSLANVEFDETQVMRRYREALELVRNNNGLPASLRMGILSEAGQSFGIEKHTPDVEAMLREAVQIGRTNVVPKTSFAVALSRLGQYLRYENRMEEAEPLLTEAVGLLSAHPTISAGLALGELGAIRVKRGDLEGGERFFRQRRDLLMSLAGPDNGTAMDARSRWAGLQARRGYVAEALQEMRENMVYCRKAFAAGSLGLWHPLSTLAYILNLADQPAEALSLAKESQACLGPTAPSDLRLAQIQTEAGIALEKLHRGAEAIPYLENCLRVYLEDPGVGPNDFRTKRAREYLDQARSARR